MLSALAVVISFVVGTTSPATRPASDTEYLRESGEERVRVVRETLVSDVAGYIRCSAASKPTRLPNGSLEYAGIVVTRYHLMYSPGAGEPERELIQKHEFASDGFMQGGAGRSSYRTLAVEWAEPDLLIYLFYSGPYRYLYAIDLAPAPNRPVLPPYPGVRIFGHGSAWPFDFSCVNVTGSLFKENLDVELTFHSNLNSIDPFDKACAASAARFGLRVKGGAAAWVPLNDLAKQCAK